VAELRRVVSLEVRTWSEIVRDNVDDVGPPPSVVEQLHLITGRVCDVARRGSVDTTCQLRHVTLGLVPLMTRVVLSVSTSRSRDGLKTYQRLVLISS